MNETEQRYHSNKQEFLALKWAITEQFHEYLSPYGKNWNEFVVRTNNNPLTYIFSLANLDAAGQRWVAHLTSYNFSLEYQKGKDNTVANFLSQMNEHLPEEEVQEYLNQILYPGVKAVLDNAIMPIEERAEQGVRLTPDCQGVPQEETIVARPARLATTNVTNWKQEQKEDPVLYQVAKHLRAPRETFKAALHKVLDKKAMAAYVKAKEQLLIKNGLLYQKTWQGQADEIVFQFVVPPFAGGMEVEGVEITKVVVTPMIPAPPEGGKRRMDFLVRSKSPNLVARKDILMTWPTPLGSGPAVSLTTVIIMRTTTSCPW